MKRRHPIRCLPPDMNISQGNNNSNDSNSITSHVTVEPMTTAGSNGNTTNPIHLVPDMSLWKAPFEYERIRKFIKYDEDIDQEEEAKEFQLMSTSDYILYGTQAMNAVLKKNKVVHGVYGICAYVLQPNFDLQTQCSFDKAHALSGICKCYVYCLAGLRGNATESVVKLSTQRGFYGGLITKSRTCPPWRLQKKSHHRIESYARCIVFPSSLRSQFRCDRFLTKTKNLHIDDVLKLCTVVLPYCISKSNDLPTEYKLLYYILCDCIVKSLTAIVDKREMDDLYEEIVEFLAISQAMLPKSECTFLKHEWIHISHNLRAMGPFASNNALVVERFLSLFKKWVSRGGRNYNLTMSNAYVRYEQMHDEEIMIEWFERNTGTHQHPIDKPKSDILSTYPTHCVESSRFKEKRLSLGNDDYYQLLETALVYEVEVAQKRNSFQALSEESALVRLYCLFCLWKQIMHTHGCQTILSWFENDITSLNLLKKYLSITSKSNTILTWILEINSKISISDIPLLPVVSLIVMTSCRLKCCNWLTQFDCSQYVQQQYKSGTHRMINDMAFVIQKHCNRKDTFVIEKVFSKAIIYGTEMCSREEFDVFVNRSLQDDLLLIKENWNKRLNLNSWAYGSHPAYQPSVHAGRLTDISKFGMINYFFEIDCNQLVIRDRAQQNTNKYQMASLFTFEATTSRDCKYLHSINLSQTSLNRQRFYFLSDVECSRVAVAYLDKMGKPYMLQLNDTEVDECIDEVSKKEFKDIQYMEPLWLTPQKLCVRSALKESGLI